MRVAMVAGAVKLTGTVPCTYLKADELLVPLGVSTETLIVPLPGGDMNWIEVGVTARAEALSVIPPQCTLTDLAGKKPMPAMVIASLPKGEPVVGMLLINGFNLVSSWVMLVGFTGAAGAPFILSNTRTGKAVLEAMAKRACIV